ncbi:MAG: hypothetical protein ACPF9D_04865, partial [Owenweeksia sp.]
DSLQISADIDFSGMLEKKGQRRTDGWKQRWFELMGSSLNYFDAQGGRGKMHQLFGKDMDGIIAELNTELVA